MTAHLKFSLLLLTILISSCSWRPKHKHVHPLHVTHHEFLSQGNDSSQDWLDTPIRLYVHQQPLSKVIQLRALQGVPIYLSDTVAHKEVSYENTGLTRRQFLWTLQQDHGFHVRWYRGSQAGEDIVLGIH